MKQKIVTLGEVMMRLQADGFAKLDQTRNLNIVYGGGEANVAISLAHFGFEAAHVTRFPDNLLGRGAIKFMREHLLDTSPILLGGDRLGLYFVENGASMRASQIVYDRFGSAFSQIKTGMIDWESVLSGATWFHWAGITPALSQGAADVCLEAVKMAKKLNITVSADIFYRSNLWNYGKRPSEVLPELTQYTDIVIANQDNIKTIFGIENDSFVDACQKLKVVYPNIKKIADTQRTSVSASHNLLKATLWNGSQLLETQNIEINPIIDRIGGGDAFIAGLIYGLTELDNEQTALDFAVAASALKHTIEGDANLADVPTVMAIVNGDVGGRLRR